MSDSLEENTRAKKYICLSGTNDGKRDLVEGNNIFIYHRMDDIRGLFRAKRRWPEGKNLVKEMRAYILVSRVIDGETWLHDLGRIDV